MRKLLVASQKGGVGKTTTSINVAAAAAKAGGRVLLLDADPLSNISNALNLIDHPRRQSLREAGVGVPGMLCSEVVPGLDVLSPYEDGHCSDHELQELLDAMALPVLKECYDCLVVDTPPFIGVNSSRLLATCDGFVLVMRAEAMASRTLPAFLELVQRARKDGASIQMHGILLTLADGEETGGRWERELRGRFGGRILPTVVPYEEEMGRTGTGQVLIEAYPDSEAAAAYLSLVATLQLAEGARGRQGRSELTRVLTSALRLAASRNLTPVGVPVLVGAGEAELEEPPPYDMPDEPEVVEPIDSLPLEEEVPPPTERAVFTEPVRTLTPTPVVPSSQLAAQPAERPAAPANPSRPTPSGSFPPWVLLAAVAAVAGIGLRFVQFPPSSIPIVVGIATAAAVVLALRLISTEGPPRSVTHPTSREPQPSQPAPRKDANTRLTNLTRRPPSRDDQRSGS